MSQQNLKIWKFASETITGILSRFFSPPQLKNCSNNENTVKSTALWKKWCLERGIAKEIENYEPTQLNTLLERFNAEIKSKHG